jgi:hypothetical protein
MQVIEDGVEIFAAAAPILDMVDDGFPGGVENLLAAAAAGAGMCTLPAMVGGGGSARLNPNPDPTVAE